MKYLFKILIIIFIASTAGAQTDSGLTYISLYKENHKLFDSSYYNIFPARLNRGNVTLVLSGGGARGISHIGVFKVLEENKIEITSIVGTSIGAITGGLYSSGYTPDELRNIAKSVNWKSKLALSNKYDRDFLFVDKKKTQDKGFITLSLEGFKPQLPNSLSNGQQLTELFNIYVLNSRYKSYKDFNNLKYNFSSVSTDIDNGEKVVLNSGSLIEAIKSSFTFPLLYSPTLVNGRNLVDGGLTANIPVSTAKDLGADFIITVNTTSPLMNNEELKDPLNTADQVLSITLAQLSKEQLKNSDIIITPALGFQKTTNFANIDFLIQKGITQTIKMIPEIISGIDTLEEKLSPNFNNFLFASEVHFSGLIMPDSLKQIILNEQQNTFVRYVTIERRLKNIYQTGIYQDLKAEIKNDGTRNIITYKGKLNPKLKSIEVYFDNGKEIKTLYPQIISKDSTNYLELKSDSYPKENVSTQKNVISDLLFSDIENFWIENLDRFANRYEYFKFYEYLLGKLRNENYSFVEIKRFYINDEGNLRIFFTDGKIDKIELKNLNKTNRSIIMSEIIVDKNNPVKKQDLEESLGGINGTNLFRQASIDIKKQDSSDIKILEFSLIEKSSLNLKFSFKADNERKLQLYTSLSNENLFGSGNEINLGLKGGLRDRDVRTELKSSRFFGSLLTYNLSLYYNSKDRNSYIEIIDNDELKLEIMKTGEYQESRYGGSFLLGTQIEKFGTVYGQISIEKLKHFSLSGINKPENDLNTFRIQVGGKLDTEDQYPFATSGAVANYYYETSRNQLSGGLSYTKFYFDILNNISLSKNSVLKPKFIFGFADKTTPSFDFFSLGGENSFFGMVEDELRGRQILVASAEYRYNLPIKIFFDTYASLRYDLGKVWENTEDIKFKDLRHGIGISLLLDTPIGKASFSAGRSFIINQGFTKRGLIWGDYTFYFSIGYDL